jgi:serine/threonine protein kinase
MVGQMQRGQTLAADTVLQGHYTILKKLSEGGMGAVYLAQDTKLFNKLCVIKEMLPFYNNEREKRIAERNFEREAKTLAHLRHPGIPEIYDYFIEDGRNYLVMAFVEGQDLQTLLDENNDGLPEQDVLMYGVQLSRVLAYLSERNPPTMHRDIKPANIILEKTTGQVKLVDFGIARDSLGSERLDGTKSIIMGTQGFAPPEQFSGRATPASDVYALGATLHYLLTGVHPLQSPTPFQFESTRAYRAEISPRLDELILEMVRPDANQRPSAKELKERFEQLTGTQITHQAFVMRSGVEVYSVGELVQACEKDPESGRYHLLQGHFREWFLAQNRHDRAEWAEQCIQEAPDDKVALEWFLRGVDPSLSPPAFELDEPVIDFGEVERDSSYSLLASFTNSSRGYLLVAAASMVPWLKVETPYVGCYVGEIGQIQLTLDTSNMPEGHHTQNALAVAWEEEQAILPVQMNVIWPPGGRMEPQEIDLGPVWAQPQPLALSLTLRNVGGSEWVGRMAPSANWLYLQQDTFRIPTGGQQIVPVRLYPQALGTETENKGQITLLSNSGSQVTTIRLLRAKPWYLGMGRLRRWLSWGAPTTLSVLGLSLGAAQLGRWLLIPDGHAARQLIPPLLALGVWLLGLLLSAVFTPVLDEMEDFHHRGDIALDTPVAQFTWLNTAPILILLAILGVVAGRHAALLMQTTASVRLIITVVGLLAGALAGLGISSGSSDYLLGTRPLTGFDWLVRRPVALGLLRTFLTSLSLAVLALMSAPSFFDAALSRSVTAALTGFILTTDTYPYLPKRLYQVMGWFRPATKTILTGYLLGTILVQILSLNVPSAFQTTFQRFLNGLIMLVSLPLGAFFSIVTHDEIGFDWKGRLQESLPLLILDMLVAPLVFIIFDVLFTLLAGALAGVLSSLTTLSVLAFLSLGLTGKNAWAEHILQQSIQYVRHIFRDTPIQKPDLNLNTTQSIRWLSQRTQFSDVSPYILSTIVLLSTLMAPLWIQVLGSLLWLIILIGLGAVIVWLWRRQEKTKSSREVQQ